MNIEFIRDKWIPALRSGEYTQTAGTLQDKDGYCCLGVACDIIARENLVKDAGWVVPESDDLNAFARYRPYDPERDADRRHQVDFRAGDHIAQGILPRPVASYIGIRTAGSLHEPIERDSQRALNLIALNDDFGMSFDEIADLLERHVNGERILLEGV